MPSVVKHEGALMIKQSAAYNMDVLFHNVTQDTFSRPLLCVCWLSVFMNHCDFFAVIVFSDFVCGLSLVMLC